LVVIEDGLRPGEEVITEGTHKVRDGSQVSAAGKAVAERPDRQDRS
jgi:hypothetical protein